MAVYTGSFNWYYSAIHYLWSGKIAPEADSFKIGLSSASYVPDKANHSLLAHITNEIFGNGYARQTLTGVTMLPDAAPFTALQTFDCENPQFEADGGDLVARYWWVFDDTPTSPADPLICYGLLDVTPADVTTLDGNVLTFMVSGDGLMALEDPS